MFNNIDPGINPYHAGYLYQLHSSLFFLINFSDSSEFQVFTSRMENNVDPDQLASEKPADLDLQCFQNGLYPGEAGIIRNQFIIDQFSLTCWDMLHYMEHQKHDNPKQQDACLVLRSIRSSRMLALMYSDQSEAAACLSCIQIRSSRMLVLYSDQNSYKFGLLFFLFVLNISFFLPFLTFFFFLFIYFFNCFCRYAK